jgi:hypothetical protein
VLLNAGDGTFADTRDYRAPGAPSAVAIADFDGDGAADLATGDGDDWAIRVFFGDGKGAFGEPLEYPLPGRPGSSRPAMSTGTA